MKPRLKRMIWIAPAAILGLLLFAAIGGEIVRLLWNWLAPALFGWKQITFWQALGLLALCRILFGGPGAWRSHRSNAPWRIRQRMKERWGQMTPEEQERARRCFGERFGPPEPPDPRPAA